MVRNCNPIECDFILRTKKKFACNLDLKCFKWKELFDHISSLDFEDSERHEELLLALTIEDEDISNYPIKKSYQLAFLKQFIAETEKYNIPYTKAYESYIDLLNSQNDSEEVCFKYYFIGERKIIIKENKNFISGGTTGLCTWEAGLTLVNWSLCQKEYFKNKVILELGCGSGLTGLAIANSSLAPKRYIFTDCHPLVLEQLKFNININIPGEEWPKIKDNTILDVVHFNWNDITDLNLNAFREADLIIGADVVYDKDLILSLTEVLQKLLVDEEKSAIIACTIRNEETVDYFVETIKSKGMKIVKDTSTYPVVLEGSFSSPVNVYIIKNENQVSV